MSYCIGIIAICVSIAAAPIAIHQQTPAPRPPQRTPDCSAPVWGDLVTAFDSQLYAYVVLRNRLAQSPAIGSSQGALAERVRTARAGAKQGDVFTAAISVEIKKSLRREIDAHTWQVIMDEDNPGELPSQVNDEYRRGEPLSTMPPNILTALPKLPKDIEYRFVGRHLILLDTRSKVVVDRIPYAVADPAIEGSCR